jgi:hypothetical protein
MQRPPPEPDATRGAAVELVDGTDRVGAVELDLPTDRYPDLSRVLAYWDSKRAGRFAPRRADIDPLDFVEVLPRVMLADVIGSPPEFRYRLSGTGIGVVHGEDFTNRSPRELKPAAFGQMIHDHYCAAVTRRVPLLHLIMLDTLQKSRSYVRLLLPLSENGQDVTMLMAVDSKEQNTSALRDYFAKIIAER